MNVLGQRLDRIENKLEQIADAMVAMARAEAKLEALQNEHNKMYERVTNV